MRNKKSDSVNIEKKKRGFFYIGVIIALAICLLALEWVYPDQNPVDIVEPMEGESTPWVLVIDDKKIPERPMPRDDYISREKVVTGRDSITDTAKFSVQHPHLNSFELPDSVLTDLGSEEIYIDPFPGVITKSITDIDERPHYESCLINGDYNPLVFDCTVDKIFSHVRKNITVPECVKYSGGEQIVLALIVLNVAGEPTEIAILNTDAVCADCAVEATRVLRSLPPMNPGVYGGMNIRVSFSIPIKFQYR